MSARNFMRRGNPAIGERFTCWNEEYEITAITGAMDDDGYTPVEAEQVEPKIHIIKTILVWLLFYAFCMEVTWILLGWLNF